ncbi:MAG: ERF family protein [Cetobacterium sp.]
MSIYKKLAEIQSEIKGLGQDKQGNGYKYVTGNKVINAIKPLMIEKGLLLKQEVLDIENERMDYLVSLSKTGDTWVGKPKSEILTKLKMRFTWIDVDTGEKDENLFGANGQNDWEKGLGSALTYAERYFLLKYFHIATDEDDIDNPDRKKKEEEETEKKKDDETKNKAVKMILELDSKQSKSELETLTIEQLRKRYADLKGK